MAENIFEQASRKKLRFDSPKGLLSVDDLWDIPLTSNTGKTNLNDISKELFRQIKDSSNTSEGGIVAEGSKADTELLLKYEVVQHIGKVRLAERDAKAAAEERAAKKQQILEIIARKENEALEGSSLEDLRRMAESL